MEKKLGKLNCVIKNGQISLDFLMLRKTMPGLHQNQFNGPSRQFSE
jgi:hypothetical protein